MSEQENGQQNTEQQTQVIPLPLTPETVWKWVSTQLMNDSTLQPIVGNKVFPFTTQEPQKLPWIVVDNIDVSYAEDKDANDADQATCIVTCAEKTYTKLNTLSAAVVAAVNMIDGCRVTNRHQSFVDDIGFVEEVSLTIDLY